MLFGLEAGLGGGFFVVVGLGTGLGVEDGVNILSSWFQHFFRAVYASCF